MISAECRAILNVNFTPWVVNTGVELWCSPRQVTLYSHDVLWPISYVENAEPSCSTSTMDISVASVASLHPALTQGIQDSPDLNRVLSLGELFSSKQADEPIGPNDAENAENLAIHLSSASGS